MDPTVFIRNLVYSEDGKWKSRSAPQNFYPDHAHIINSSAEDKSFWFRHRANCVVDMIKKFPPAGPVFDLGGGTGYLAMLLTKCGIPTALIEPNPAGIAFAKSRGLPAVIQGSIETLDFIDNCLPAIGLFDVAEHVQDDIELFKTIYSKLSTGGRLYLTVPTIPLLWSNEDVNAGHFRRYHLKALVAKLRKIGFKIEFQSHFFSFLVAGIFLLRTVPSWLGLRKHGQWDKYQNEVYSASSNFIVEKLCQAERYCLKSKTMPIGSSAIVCARR